MENSMNILLWIGIAVVVAAVFGVNYYFKKKRKDSSWRGTVIDKNMSEQVHRSDPYGDNRPQRSSISIGGFSLGGGNTTVNSVAVTHKYTISVRPDNSSEAFNWDVSSGFYEQVAIGDTVAKNAGTLTPEIITKASAPLQTPPSVPPTSPMPPTPPTGTPL